MNNNFTERIVAFVDILGFKTMVNDSVNNPDIAANLHTALKKILKLKQDNEDILEVASLKQFGVEVTVFSDSIVISYPLDFEGGFFYVLMELIHLQLELASNGILIRGGIAIGQIYHDGEIVYGSAMNEAYRRESEEAIYPRIILSRNDIITGVEKTRASHNTKQEELEYISRCIREDKDGWYFIDMLNQPDELSDFGNEYYLWLRKVRNIIVSGLNRYRNNRKIFEKYKWLRNYYNDVVTNEVASYPVVDDERKRQIEYRKEYTKLKIKKLKSKYANYH